MIASLTSPLESDTLEMDVIIRRYLESRDYFLSASRHVDCPGLKVVFEDVAVHRSLLAQSTAELIDDPAWTHADVPDPELISQHWWLRMRHHFEETTPERALRHCAASERSLAASLQDMLDSKKLTGPHQAIIGEALASVHQSLDALETAAGHLHAKVF